MKLLTLLLLTAATLPAQKTPVARLVELARSGSAVELRAALGEANVQKGLAWSGEGSEFIFVVESEKPPMLMLDDGPAVPMSRAGSTNLWYDAPRLSTGRSHAFHYLIDGARFGGRQDIPAYMPECYARPGVPQGQLTEKLIHTSRIYEGMKSDYWIYVPGQYNSSTPAALMVWQDGEGHINRDGGARTLNVVDNLIHQGKMPVTILVLISPGLAGERRMRSIEYDTVDDTYARFLRDEILAEVVARYNIRRDAYSRAIAGNSSGGICSFNVAWQQPEQFSRVLSRIGSFTSIQWRPGVRDGGNVYPNKIRKEPKRNIRVWLQDGSEDLENDHGSWPLQNIQMANSLKLRGYDFHLSWGNGSHNGAHGNAELPAELIWLWRDYDQSKTEQIYEMEAAEKLKPMFRVKIYNRD